MSWGISTSNGNECFPIISTLFSEIIISFSTLNICLFSFISTIGPSSWFAGIYFGLSSESEDDEDDSTCCCFSSLLNLLTCFAFIICFPFAIIFILLQLTLSLTSNNIVAANFSPG